MATGQALADPSGRRAIATKLLGRLVAVALIVWLIGLALAGLDIVPGNRFLLGRSLSGQRPPSLVAPPASKDRHQLAKHG